jgi:AraC-like DNA-binding protein
MGALPTGSTSAPLYCSRADGTSRLRRDSPVLAVARWQVPAAAEVAGDCPGAVEWVAAMLLRHEGFRRLCRARDLLREVNEAPLSIAEVAREVQISPFHFIRVFEAVFGVTPHQFRIQARLDTAKDLLAAGHHSVTEVCLEVGFSSLGSFSALFAQRVGEPPSVYRRRVRRMVQIPGVLPVELTPGCLSLMGRLPPATFADACRSFREA